MKKVLALALLSLANYLGAQVSLELTGTFGDVVVTQDVALEAEETVIITDNLTMNFSLVEEREDGVTVHIDLYDSGELVLNPDMSLQWDEPAELATLSSQDGQNEAVLSITAHNA